MNNFNQVKTFRDLRVWRDAHNLALSIYKITKKFPDSEQYGLTNQIRRAASSVGANIAEGFGRFHFKEKAKFYLQARGSNNETQNHLLLARDLGYMEEKQAEELFELAESVNRQINGLINKTTKNL